MPWGSAVEEAYERKKLKYNELTANEQHRGNNSFTAESSGGAVGLSARHEGRGHPFDNPEDAIAHSTIPQRLTGGPNYNI